MTQISLYLTASFYLCCSIILSCNPSISKLSVIEKTDLKVHIYLNATPTNDPHLKAAMLDLKRSFSFYTNISWVDNKNEANYLIDLNINKNIENLENNECFNIVLTKSGLTIEGKSNLAMINGIYSLLGHLNFHWYFPGDIWHTKPNSKVFSPFEISIKNSCPVFLSRKFSYTYGIGNQKNIRTDYNLWKSRNRMNGLYEINSGHSYKTIVPKPMFKTHPEWFGLINGKRNRRGQLCLSNEDLHGHAKNWIRNFILEKPHLDIISVSPNDGDFWCSCEHCIALGSKTDRAVFFANMLAKEIEIDYPNKFIRLNAYLGTAEPATISAHKNVIIYIATLYSKFKLNELAEFWKTKANNFGIREYHNIGVGVTDLPQNKIKHYQQQILNVSDKNFWGYQSQTGNQWIPSGLDYFLTSKLLWNPKLNIDEEKERFFLNTFGEANHIMREYYSLYNNAKTLDLKTIQKMIDLVEQASNLNQSEIIQTRIKYYKLYLIWLHKFYQLDNKTKVDRIIQSKECLLLVWRSRNLHVLHAAGHFNRFDKYYPGLKHLTKKDISLLKREAIEKGNIEFEEIDSIFNLFKDKPIINLTKRSAQPVGSQTTIEKTKKRFSKNGPQFRRKNTFLFLKENKTKKIELSTKDIRGGILRCKISPMRLSSKSQTIELSFDNNHKEITIDLDSIKNGLYKIEFEADWLSYRLKSTENIYWWLSYKNPGSFENVLNGYVLNNSKSYSLKLHLKSREKSRPRLQLIDINGEIFFSGEEVARLGHVYNIKLDKNKGKNINIQLDKNALINNIYLSEVYPIISFDGNFDIIKPYLSLLDQKE